jgi:SAM-dependent methyltransferase
MFTLSPSGLLNRDGFDPTKYHNVDPTFLSRYLLQAAVLEAYQQHQGMERLKVLDVGGAGSILHQFIEVDLSIIDILPNEANRPNYVQGSALDMPFPDDDFDAVISCDVLEHIPKNDRTAFLKESARVTKDLVILAAPFNLPGVRDAEIAANDYYKKMIGTDHPWLIEHLQDDLPNLQQAHNTLDLVGLHTSHFSHTALNNWQLVTRAGFLLSQTKYPDFIDQVELLNQYYLGHLMEHDFSATGYRTFLLGSKQHKIDIKPEPDILSPELMAIFTLLTDAILPLL